MGTQLEHIDPIRSEHVCGLRNEHNEIIADDQYNWKKSNRFVPYRVCDYPAPVNFGDRGEFLINDEWVVCEFGGKNWWLESNRIGNSQRRSRESCARGGKTQGDRNVKNGKLKSAREARWRKHVGSPVVLTRIEDGHVFYFDKIKDACEMFGLCHSHIIAVADGHRRTHSGFTAVRFH